MELFSEIPLRFLSRFVSLLWVRRRAAKARHISGPFILPMAVARLQSIWKFYDVRSGRSAPGGFSDFMA